MAFGISEAEIVGLWLETLFWGFFLVSFGMCLRSLLFGENGLKSKSSINWPMFAVCITLFVFASVDVAIGLYHNIQAFILYSGPGGSDAVFSSISDWVTILRSLDTFFQSLIGDAMLIFRCFVVYNRNWKIVAFSIALWVGSAVTTALAMYYIITLDTHALISASILTPLITSFWACSIVLNILTTSLLVIRIWKIDRMNQQSGALSFSDSSRGSTRRKRVSRLQRVMYTIIESGAMYTTVAIITFITYVSKSNATYGTSDVEIQVVGIAFNLIIIRAAERRTIDYTMGASSNTLSLPLSVRRPTVTGITAADGDGNLEVIVSQQTDHFHDGKDSRIRKDIDHSDPWLK